MIENKREILRKGTVIPAHPLALNEDRSLDELNQRALTHYYIDAGVGGLAVGVHTTQFEIRDPEFNLYDDVLRMASEEVVKRDVEKELIMIAGLAGPTEQACNEARIAKKYNYDSVLLSMGHLPDYSEEELLDRARKVAEIMPVFGFYLQPSAGGRILSFDFWKEFMQIENVIAVKIAPFNRYQSIDVMNAVLLSPRWKDITVYTGNDDNIVADLLTEYSLVVDGELRQKQIVGGLLGHWSVWTQKAVELFEDIQAYRDGQGSAHELLKRGTHVTDTNAAFFDVRNNFKGCIAGINEVLARQGLLKGNWCLLDKERLSADQSEYIDLVYERYPELNDDQFVKENLEKWRGYASK
ncbi:dihydrodipicolinate synthase family protein [Erysipelothrix urinaevulpis]|uniref:dihydrodipicolinate synthase family protein n=1 Tax=Erysipelothrix urinaevulpis TaxID=2683717 RepID=UPI00135C9CEE|nr:dihydrodipicolinate synthase family protein [Erysipelothrix urinaevulpis]